MTIAPLFFRPSLEWELLPDDYPLPDDPVDNTTQPLLAEALRESLDLADLLPSLGFVATNLGICTKVAGQFVVKAPDWVYVPQTAQRLDQRRSYTPEREGSLPLLVLEFLSETEGGEYSLDPNYPYGKWYFYERLLQVPYYGIFEPQQGRLEVYQWEQGHYQRLLPNPQQHYWIEPLHLFLGVWSGERSQRSGYWLRWWDAQDNRLLWGVERIALEQEKVQQERQRADRLTEQLRALGIEPEA